MQAQFFRRYFDIAPGDGTPKEPSLLDLDDPNYAANQKLASDKAAADKLAADNVQAAADAATYTALVIEAKNADGTLKTGYILNNEGRVEKIASQDDNSTGDDNNSDDNQDGDDAEVTATFYKEVDKLHGFDIPVEYPNDETGNPIDPNSAQGVYIRDKALIQMAQDSFEKTIATQTPRGYAYLLHIQAGGDDESFFSNKSFSLPEYETFKESAELQKSIYKSSLTTRGVEEDVANDAVEKAIKNNKLFELADKAYKSTQAGHQKELDEITRKNADAERLSQQATAKYTGELKAAINEGKVMKFTVPDTDKAAFQQFVIDHTQIENGQFLIVRPVKDFATQLEALWYEFKKGDFGALIKREAQSQNVRKLKAVIDKSKDKGTGGSGGGGNKSVDDFIPLSRL